VRKGRSPGRRQVVKRMKSGGFASTGRTCIRPHDSLASGTPVKFDVRLRETDEVVPSVRHHCPARSRSNPERCSRKAHSACSASVSLASCSIDHRFCAWALRRNDFSSPLQATSATSDGSSPPANRSARRDSTTAKDPTLRSSRRKQRQQLRRLEVTQFGFSDRRKCPSP